MVYLDTSALVPAFIREPKSEDVLAWLEASHEPLAISEWSMTEFASATAIKLRTGQIGAALAGQAWMSLLDFAEAHCLIAVPGRSQFGRAADLVREPGSKLRAGDALHVAIAEAIAESVLSLDDAMLESVKGVGLKAIKL